MMQLAPLCLGPSLMPATYLFVFLSQAHKRKVSQAMVAGNHFSAS
jgi:hypothetical protein